MVVKLAILEFGCLFAWASFVFLWSPTQAGPPDAVRAVTQGIALALLCLVSFSDLYDLRVLPSIRGIVRRWVPALAIASCLVAPFAFWTFELQTVPLALVGMAGLAVLVRATAFSLFKRPRFTQRILLVGDSPIALKIVNEVQSLALWRYSIDGRIIENGTPPEPSVPWVPIIGNIDESAALIERYRPDRVVTALSERRGRFPVESLLKPSFECIAFEDGVEFYERLTKKLAVESLRPSHLLYSRDFKRPNTQLFLRRAISLSVAFGGLILYAPLLALIALLIKLDSKGPVFFRQERAGLAGKTFQLIKFRTMHQVADGSNGSVWNRDNGSRTTRIGRILRPLRLDEIPQFINVLRGDMDFVGPRPEMASNIPEMTKSIPYYGLRTMVRPGVTGWAQINMGYAVTLEEVTEKLRYDLYYLKHMSLGLDLRIILSTVKTVLSSRGE